MKIIRILVKLYFLLLLNNTDVFAEPSQNYFSISLATEAQESMGLEITSLTTSILQNEIPSFATRVNLTPLLKQRSNYFAQLANVQVKQLQIKQTQAEIKRLKILTNKQAVSSRKLLTKKSQLAIYLAEIKASKNKLRSLSNQFTAQWGGTLNNWFLSENEPHFQQIKQFKQHIYITYLPANILLAPEHIFLHPNNFREQAKKAQLISSTPNDTSSHQVANAFFYLAEPFSTPRNRVKSWIPSSSQGKTGIIIPQSALVWRLGQSFVYLQVDDEVFKRVKITKKIRINSHSYFIQHPLQANDRLVTLGAQTLLSEEFRGQIPAEDDDDDD